MAKLRRYRPKSRLDRLNIVMHLRHPYPQLRLAIQLKYSSSDVPFHQGPPRRNRQTGGLLLGEASSCRGRNQGASDGYHDRTVKSTNAYASILLLYRGVERYG